MPAGRRDALRRGLEDLDRGEHAVRQRASHPLAGQRERYADIAGEAIAVLAKALDRQLAHRETGRFRNRRYRGAICGSMYLAETNQEIRPCPTQSRPPPASGTCI